MQNGIIRRRIDLYGWVQGVGLRWRAENAANALGVTGWVRNNFDAARMDIEEEERIVLSTEARDALLSLLDNPPEPNDALKRLFQ